eukprot:TRINITY_DN160_c0_g1_i1.p1 TRINITY_DN160_c0_g1~~TRINITY_DN160_c0_g1_i1.p1  ORF type:complete len:164 (+),score=22.21 TRINITY_DN160_c0_g1_i1:174-665(+)
MASTPRGRANSWSCNLFGFGCGGDDEETVAPVSVLSRSLTDDLFWEPPQRKNPHLGSGASGNSSASMTASASQSASTGATASLTSILEDDPDLTPVAAPNHTASRCDGPRCFNCGSISVSMLGSDLPDAQDHHLMPNLRDESFCNSDCIWTYLFRAGSLPAGP